jgi:hypothetical protein
VIAHKDDLFGFALIVLQVMDAAGADDSPLHVLPF